MEQQCFSSLKNLKKLLLNFYKILQTSYKNGKQKTANLLNSSEHEYSKLATKKWHIIDSETKGNYSHENPIKFLTSSLESSLWDYSDPYVLVTGNITIVGTNNNTKVALKYGAPFRKCKTEINETFIDEAQYINIATPMYNLIEYSDNYSDT